MNFNLKESTILVTVAGSRAYGMNRPDSDVDLKGIAIPPAGYFHGFFHRFEQCNDRNQIKNHFYEILNLEERSRADEGEVEGTVYDIRKFFKLAAESNPNILDTLFCRDSEVRFSTPIGDKLRENAKLFLSKKARWTFSGYAFSQLKRIKKHRKWLMRNKPLEYPSREEFGLPERSCLPKEEMNAALSAINKEIDSWEIDFAELDESTKLYIQSQMAEYLAKLQISSNDKFAAAARLIGYDEKFIHLCQKEKEYRAALKEYHQYQEWVKNRNPERAEIERKFGLDLKHATHLIRLIRMCREILEKGEVNVWRQDREELLAIRNGEWTYEKIVEFAEKEDKALSELYNKCDILPAKPNYTKLQELCMELVEDSLRR